MITTNAIRRVFNVRYGGATGTAFAIDHEERQYLISAKHVFPDIIEKGTIEIKHEGTWKTIEVTVTGRAAGKLDVIVLSPSIRLSPAFDLPLASGGMVLGQDVHFLGFPYGLSTEVGEINNDLPVPLIKRACISGKIGEKKKSYWLLDGLNNPGFSGGPVVFQKVHGNDRDTLYVMAIISAYRVHEEPIYQNGSPLPINSRSNTGIIIAYDSDIAKDLITQNPNGLKLKKGEQDA